MDYTQQREQAVLELRAMARPFAAKIAPLYEMFNFTFGDNETPDAEELEATINGLIKYVAEDEDGTTTCSTGRITVGYESHEDGTHNVEMSMAIDAEDVISD
jgi:hypothetical protein